ncbi:MAG: sigma-70 family RNA polymerase sigma factor [Planctomycetia bacterium]|nr:sigma-70 family RNA polymerase sigma factor [Planctomycetia bacterium]
MDSSTPSNPDAWGPLIKAARAGSNEALGDLFVVCRDYLLLVANTELDRDLRAKVGASDVVQDALVEAQCSFDRFHGDDRLQLLAWLRAILLHKLSNAHRHYSRTSKRNVAREVSWDDLPGDGALDVALDDSSPSKLFRVGEAQDAVRHVLNGLPEPLRRVIELRNWDRRTFAEIGRELGYTTEGARKLWFRAITILQRRYVATYGRL